MDPLKQTILDYVAKEYLDADADVELDETTPLITGGIVDSFSMVSLKVFLEKKYAIRIPDDDATPLAFDTVQSIAELVTRIREAAPKAVVS